MVQLRSDQSNPAVWGFQRPMRLEDDQASRWIAQPSATGTAARRPTESSPPPSPVGLGRTTLPPTYWWRLGAAAGAGLFEQGDRIVHHRGRSSVMEGSVVLGLASLRILRISPGRHRRGHDDDAFSLILLMNCDRRSGSADREAKDFVADGNLACSTAARRPTAPSRSSSPPPTGPPTPEPGVIEVAAGAALFEQEVASDHYRADLSIMDGSVALARQLFDASGVSRADIDVAMVYDAFSPILLMQLEALGFCGFGEAGDFIAEGNLAPKGALPCNTNGGLIGEGYIHGLNLALQGIRQLPGMASTRSPTRGAVLVTATRTGAILPTRKGSRPVTSQRKSAMTSVLEGSAYSTCLGIAGPVAGMLLADNRADVSRSSRRGVTPSVPFRDRRCGCAVGAASARPGGRADRATVLAWSGRLTWSSKASPRGRPSVSAHTPPAAAATEPGELLHHRLPAGHPAHRTRPAYDAVVAARLDLLHEQRGHLGGPVGPHERRGALPRRSPDPRGDGTGFPGSGPIFTHTPWPSMCAATGDVRDQRGPAGPVAHRSRSARRDLVAPSRPDPHRVEVAEGRSQRRARVPHLDLRRTGGQGILPVRGRPVDREVGTEPPVHPVQRGRRHAGGAARHRQVRNDRSASAPDREHRRPGPLPPELVEAVARFHSGDWVRVAARAACRSSWCALPRRRWPTLRCSPSAWSSTSNTPITACCVRWASLRPERDSGSRAGPGPPVGEHTDELRAEASRSPRRTGDPAEPGAANRQARSTA